jgi:hypothetical protein
MNEELKCRECDGPKGKGRKSKITAIDEELKARYKGQNYGGNNPC